jgi:hypothetical protein
LLLLLPLLVAASPARADSFIDIPYSEVVEKFNEGGNCSYYRYYLQFSEVSGASSYSALNRYHGGGFTLNHHGPPFPDDDVQGEGYHWTAPPGSHRFGATAGSGPGPCTDSVKDEWEPDYVRANFTDFKVNGVVTKNDGSPAAGVSIKITGPGSDTVTTASDGSYTSKKFTVEGPYTVATAKDVYCATGVDPCTNQRVVQLPPNAKVDFVRLPGAHPAYKWRGVSNSCLGVQQKCGNDANTVDIKFDASASTPPDGRSLVKYLWEFGDGQTGEGQKVSHLFGSRKAYAVKLTTEDDQGERESITTTVQTCVGDTTGGTTLGRRFAGGLLRPFAAKAEEPAAPFTCYSLFAGGSGQYAGAFVRVPPPEDTDPPAPDTIGDVVMGESLPIGGEGWEQGDDLQVQFRDIACDPGASACDHAQKLTSSPTAPGPSVNWDGTFTPSHWPRHWPDRDVACHGYVHAEQPLSEVPGFIVRRRVVLTGRPAGEVVFASGSKEWKTGDIYCEGESPMHDAGDGVVLVTHPFDDPPPLQPINAAVQWRLPPVGAPLFVWSDAAYVALATAPVYLQPGAEMCVGVWSDEEPYARNVVVQHDPDGSVTGREVSRGSCPKLSDGSGSSGLAAVRSYGLQASYWPELDGTFTQIRTKQCYGLINALTRGRGGESNFARNIRVIQAPGSVSGHAKVTCTQRRNSHGELVGQAQLADNRALFVDGDLHLRLAVFGDWMIVANGRLTLDQGVILGGSVKEGDWARAGLLAAGAIQIGRGPKPRKLTEDESKELLALADRIDEQAEIEGWLGFKLSLVDLAADLLPGFAKHSITALGLVFGYRGATAPAISRELRRAASNYDPEPEVPLDPEMKVRSARVAKPHVLRLPPIRAGGGLSRRTARLLTSLRTNRLRMFAFTTAFARSLDRADTAAEKNKNREERVQILAAARYARTLAGLLESDVRLSRKLAASLRGSLRRLKFKAADVRAVARAIKRRGLPRAYLRIVRRAGVDRGTLYAQRQAVLGLSKRKAARRLLSVLTDRKLHAADLRAAKMFRLIARRFAKQPTRPG